MKPLVLAAIALAVPLQAQSNELHFETEQKGIGLWDFDPVDAYLAEVDGDGITDLVARGFKKCRLVEGNPDGTFAWAGADLPLPLAWSHLLADVDGDGLADWIHTDYLPAQGAPELYVGVQLGNGTPGSWWGPATSYYVGPCPNYSALGDLNRDGFSDLATSLGFIGGGGVNTMLNDGAGGFVQAYVVGMYPTVHRIACADVTGDGFADVACQDSDRVLFFFEGLGDGTLAPPSNPATETTCNDVTIVDLDDDGQNEVVSQGSDGRIDVYGWTEGSGLVEESTTVLEIHARFDRTDDYDGDGRPDLIGRFLGSQEAGIAVGNGDGTFSKAYPLPEPGLLGRPADLDGDGLPELTLLWGENNESFIYRNASQPSPWSELSGASPGAAGAPELEAHGVLLDGTWTHVGVSNAPALGLGLLAVGGSTVDQALFGGVLVPAPEVLLALGTTESGEFNLEWFWPAGVPSGTALYFQAWLLDPSAQGGWSSTNGVVGSAP